MIRIILYKAASICCLFFIYTFANAQEKVSFEIRIVDSESGDVIPYLRAQYKPSMVVFSNEEGLLILNEIDLFDSLFVSGMGYDERFLVLQIADNEQLEITRKTYELAGIHVTGFRRSALNMSTAAAIGIVHSEVLRSNDQTSLQNAVNMIPGVSMESRGYGGSQRINIRGSFLRAPFAVRNVKMYLEGIPLSSPDGSSPLELMDAFDVGKIEIIKGQGGSVYGSGTGGVMLFSSPIRKDDPDMSFQSNYMSGAFGLKRTSSAYQVKLKNSRLRVSHVYQENDGYRIQEFNRKQQLTLMLQTSDPEKKTSNFIYASYFNGHLGLPGGLNASQVVEDPMQANLFSAQNNASLYRERLNVGISGKMPVSKSWDYEGSAYFNLTNKQNPFGTSAVNNGYKDEKAWGYGARSVLSTSVMQKEDFSWNLSLGIEHQIENFEILESSNVVGLPGTPKYHYDVEYISTFAFVRTDVKILDRLIFEAGISSNYLSHNAEGSGGGIEFNESVSLDHDFLPRVSLSYMLLRDLWLHASLAKGNSNPTIFEQVDAIEGTYNLDLRPEEGINKEVSLKGIIPKTGIQFEINAYEFNLTNAIIGYNDSVYNDQTTLYEDVLKYRNSGSTIQRGIEAQVYRRFNLNGSFWNNLDLSIGFTTTDYRYDEYTVSDFVANSKQLPGVMKNNLMSSLTLNCLRERIKLHVNHYWNDRAPLTNDNLYWSESYHLINTRLDLNLIQSPSKHFVVGTYVGINNVLDEEYTSFLQVNAPFNRFFNPSPGRNFFFGFSLKMPLSGKEK